MINYSMMGLMTHREHLAAEKKAREQELAAVELLKESGIIPYDFDLDNEVLVFAEGELFAIPKEIKPELQGPAPATTEPEPTEDNKKIMEAMREFMKQQGQKSCNLDPGCESCQ